MNQLFLYKHPSGGALSIGIGSRGHNRRVVLTEDEALRLAYRLMSLAKGGATQGVEALEREPGQCPL